MMENASTTLSTRKRSKGVTIIGILAIAFSVVFGFAITMLGAKVIAYSGLLKAISSLDYLTILMIGASCSLLIFGIGVLKLLNWARKGLIVVAIYGVAKPFIPPINFWEAIVDSDIFFLIPSIICVMFFGVVLYYLTRPKVKEQFKKEVEGKLDIRR